MPLLLSNISDDKENDPSLIGCSWVGKIINTRWDGIALGFPSEMTLVSSPEETPENVPMES